MSKQQWGQWGPQQQPYQQGPYGPPPRRSQAPTVVVAGLLVAVLAVIGVIVASGSGDDDKDRDPVFHTVNRAQYETTGRQWPLTVEWAILDCMRQENTAYFVTARVEDGTTYALNPWAERVYPRIDPIWADVPGTPGVRVSIGPMVEEAMSLCE